MNTKALKIVRKHFNHPDTPIHVRRHNMRQWVRSIRYLGDRWLLAQTRNLSKDGRDAAV